ncbi:aldehyde dehydrogenase family protein [Methanonatronarchaeum sp. AMET6-2]|uniref:aldehyde dehydrogenase family protein n=1 Tax=Methanonatronarchaeum sp. AMET6-2 TaxID=2933293 RepID=UPI001FF194D0|nr:aldehyde dehydrogenase family protein [Methanonatronarchaeum sp. AMET6-2]UOY09370.1 aldehyde dehydrogenase family protein [Methanonatronarchaeum sp. AMET6-2]
MDLKAFSPETGKVIKRIPSATTSEIEEAYEKAVAAQETWSETKIEARVKTLRKLRKTINQDLSSLVKTITEDTGKVPNEALMADILPTLDQIKYYEENAGQILKTQKRKSPIYFRKNKSYVKYEALGVVSIIAPWNYPFQLALIPTITAITAGNTVLLKPSEDTPLVGEKIRELLQESDINQDIIHVLQGGKQVGEKLVDIAPDKIFFTGSTTVGKTVMKNAAKNLTPLSLELGGKDPMIIHKDADIDRATSAAVYGAFSNTGQTCVSIERVYTHQEIHKEFLEKAIKKTEKLKLGTDKESDLGPMTKPQQADKVMEHIKDAVQKGATIEIGGERENQYIHPTILTDVDHTMKIMNEETFGPTMPIQKTSDIDEAIQLANKTRYGLNASIFTKNPDTADKITGKLKTGNIYINDAVKNIGNPYLPFGGAKQSGLGRYHGPEGLKAFSNTKSIMKNNNKKPELNWFPYTTQKHKNIMKAVNTLHGDINPLNKIRNLISLIKEL